MADLGNIDDLLMGGKSNTQPQSPEHQPEVEYGDPIDEDSGVLPEQSDPDEPEPETDDDSPEPEEDKPEASTPEPTEMDEYGNPKNEVIRERLKQQARKYEAEIQSLRAQLAQQGASQQVQQAAQDFEYNPEASGDWQQQLKSFIKQTVSSMSQEEAQQQQRVKEQQIQVEFESKFRQGMNNFDDFVDVVGQQPITDAMTIATRNMQDPAAFLYAAAKRAPEEIARISKIADPLTQMVEMRELEVRMRKPKQTTKAPRPVVRHQEDLTIPHKSDKKETIEDLIAKSDAKKLAQMKARRR